MKNNKTVFSLILLALFLVFAGSLHAAAGVIEKVIYNANDGKTESVVFHLSGPCLPKAFALKGENPRVVFDFMETGLAKSVPSLIDAQGTMVTKIRMGRHTTKTRVVIDLNSGGEYNFDQHFDETKNILTIQLFSTDFPVKGPNFPVKEPKKEVVAAAATPAVVVVEEKEKLTVVSGGAVVEEETTVVVAAVAPPEKVVKESLEKPIKKPVKKAAEKPVKEPVKKVVKEVTPPKVATPSPVDEKPLSDALLSDVSFENTADKGEMVLFKLNGFYPPTVKGEEEGTPLVICEFAGTRIGEKVIKDQKIQGEFVKRVRVQHIEKSDLIRVTLELTSNKNYDLQQVFFKEDNLFVIIVNSYDSMDAATKE